MPPKKFNSIIKKKIKDKRILYKIEWTNGAISYEPFTELDYELLKHVEKWELQQIYLDQQKNQQPPEEQVFTAPKKIKASDVQKPELKEKIIQQPLIKKPDQPSEEELQKQKPQQEAPQSDSKRDKKQKKIVEKTSLKPKQSTTSLIQPDPLLSVSKQGSDEDQAKQKTDSKSKIKVHLKSVSQISEQIQQEQEVKTKKLKEKIQQAEVIRKDAPDNIKSTKQREVVKPEKEALNQETKPSQSPRKKIVRAQAPKEQQIKEAQPQKEIQKQQKEVPNQQETKPVEPTESTVKSPSRRHLCVKAARQSKRNQEESSEKGEDKNQLLEQVRSEIPEGLGHQPKISIPCKILQARKKEELQQLEFLVQYEDSESPTWISQIEIREKAPRALSEYLLSRVSWGFGK